MLIKKKLKVLLLLVINMVYSFFFCIIFVTKRVQYFDEILNENMMNGSIIMNSFALKCKFLLNRTNDGIRDEHRTTFFILSCLSLRLTCPAERTERKITIRPVVLLRIGLGRTHIRLSLTFN